MNYEFTEKLITLIQSHGCIYKKTDRDYKNGLKKEMAWEKIASELNQSKDSVKSKWKNLKDGYTKYKKQTNDTSGQKKAYVNWIWGPYLQFLDQHIGRRRTSTDEAVDQNSRSGSSSPDVSLSPKHAMKTEIHFVPEFEMADTNLIPETISAPSRKRTCEEDDDDVPNFLCNKKKRDPADLLFASYAETFKKLKLRTQTSIKLRLAQFFAEAELSDANA